MNEKLKQCETCKYYAADAQVCCNADSEHVADFRLKQEFCDKWENAKTNK